MAKMCADCKDPISVEQDEPKAKSLMKRMKTVTTESAKAGMCRDCWNSKQPSTRILRAAYGMTYGNGIHNLLRTEDGGPVTLESIADYLEALVKSTHDAGERCHEAEDELGRLRTQKREVGQFLVEALKLGEKK